MTRAKVAMWGESFGQRGVGEAGSRRHIEGESQCHGSTEELELESNGTPETLNFISPVKNIKRVLSLGMTHQI